MSSNRLRVHNTDTDNLITNLRGEVGEVVFAWVLMRGIMGQAAGLRATGTLKDPNNPQLVVLDALVDKLGDEIVARIAELAEQKIGRLTFHFAYLKLNQLERETDELAHFVERKRFREKRNYDISHKELPEKWTNHKFIHIPYPTILRGIVTALRLMKRIDAIHLGPRASYLWREMRRRRYRMMYPAKAGYMLLPYLWLPPRDRKRIIREELNEGREIWKDMRVSINGSETTVKTYGELGALVLRGRLVLLDEPFVELTSIDFPREDGESTKVQTDTAQ